jgi:hypothetical protein
VKDDSVDLERLRDPLKSRLPLIEKAVVPILRHGLIITSAADGKHSYKSAHYRGDAIDLRTWTTSTSGEQISVYLKRQLVRILQRDLGPGYDVVAESTHIHIELDPKTPEEMEEVL